MVKLCLKHFLIVCGLVTASPALAQDEVPPEAKIRIELTGPLAHSKSLEERLEVRGAFETDRASVSSFAAALEETLGFSVMLVLQTTPPKGFAALSEKQRGRAFNPRTQLSFNLKNVRLRTALQLILEEQGLTYVIDEEVLLIATLADAAQRLERRVYDCRPLLAMPSPVRIKRFPRPFVVSKAPRFVEEIKPQEPVGPDGGYNSEDLVELLTTMVEPDSWDDVGGPGSISEFKGLVIVTQTREIHAKTEALLNMLEQAGGIDAKVKASR